MPSGKVHARTTVLIAITVSAACFIYDEPQMIAVGVVSGLFLHPDLDVDAGSDTNKMLKKAPIVGEMLEWSWSKYWYLYAVFAKHRGIISHSFIFGTAIRLLCAFWWLNLIPGSRFHDTYAIGLVISDTAHILMDMWAEFIDGFRLLRNKRS